MLMESDKMPACESSEVEEGSRMMVFKEEFGPVGDDHHHHGVRHKHE